MRIRFFKAIWGMEGDLEANLRRIAEAGYDGFEMYIAGPVPDGFDDLRRKYGLDWVALISQNTPDKLADAMEYYAPHEPVRYVCHSGRDYLSFEEGKAFFERVLAKEREVGIPVSHETHRSRLLYSPYQARDFLEAIPDLRINADFSHWVCVCECMLEEIDDIVALASERTTHLHARIGHPEGPQVSDPRAPEFAPFRERFESWWTRIKEMREKDGTESLIVVPEYGPPGYMPTLPYTRQPVADLFEICLWQTDRLRELWGLPVRR